MEIATSDFTQHELYNTDSEFRALVDRHRRYEARLADLNKLPHPTELEIEEEADLKRKKLATKDQLHNILEKHLTNG